MAYERILSGMSDRPHSPENLPPPVCPPPPAAELAEAGQHGMTRRELLKASLLAGVYAAAAGTALGRISNEYTTDRWGNAPARIVMADGAEALPTGGQESIVFMGYGQQDPTNAVNQLSDALDRQQAVAGLYYPSGSFVPLDLAIPLARHLRERHVEQLNLVGFSMGTNIALETIRCIMLSNGPRFGQAADGADSLMVPQLKINYWIACSSPANLQDAFQGELADTIVAISDATGYDGDAAGKLLYDIADQVYNQPIYTDGARGLARMAVNGWLEMNNDTPPRMALSQLRILRGFDWPQQAPAYRMVATPGARVLYVRPRNDTIVNDDSGENGFRAGFREIDVANFHIVSTGNSDHANTVASARAVGQWFAGQSALSAVNAAGLGLSDGRPGDP